MEIQVKSLQISEEHKEELILESEKMAGAQVPDGLNLNTQKEVIFLIKHSFIKAFDKVNLITTAMVWLSVLVAYIFIQPKREVIDD